MKSFPIKTNSIVSLMIRFIVIRNQQIEVYIHFLESIHFNSIDFHVIFHKWYNKDLTIFLYFLWSFSQQVEMVKLLIISILLGCTFTSHVIFGKILKISAFFSSIKMKL